MLTTQFVYSLDPTVDLIQQFLIEILASIHVLEVSLELVHSHGVVLPFYIIIVLIHVQHDYSICQRKCCISIGKRLTILFLNKGKATSEKK
jgi:hypothetical protein